MSCVHVTLASKNCWRMDRWIMNQAKQSKAKRMTTGLTTVTKPGARLDDETRRFAAEEKARARGLFLDRRQRQLQVGGALLQWRSPSLRYGCCRHSVKIKNFYSFLPFSNTKKRKKETETQPLALGWKPKSSVLPTTSRLNRHTTSSFQIWWT